MPLPEVTIYTDGSCDPNPGPGGWAAILLMGEHRKEVVGHEPNATNNRMELRAVIAALTALKRPCHVQLHTDSQYVQRGVTEWLQNWKAKDWQTKAGHSIANREVWEALDAALQPHTIEWHWVKGHAGDELNEAVDRLAAAQIPRLHLPLAEAEAAHIFTAVSCRSPTGPGAWAAVVRVGDTIAPMSGIEAQTSANRLHLWAALRGLEHAPTQHPAHIYTPSDYAAQGAQNWSRAWAAQGWHTKDGQPVKHREVWQALAHQATLHPVQWHVLKMAASARPPEAQQAEALVHELAAQLSLTR